MGLSVQDNGDGFFIWEYREGRPLPPYSTDIAAAWEVAQKIVDMDSDHEFSVHLSRSEINECTIEVRYWDHTDERDPVLAGPYYLTEKTAPLAICLAALRAVGIEVR